jgi:hypothetical protein
MKDAFLTKKVIKPGQLRKKCPMSDVMMSDVKQREGFKNAMGFGIADFGIFRFCNL